MQPPILAPLPWLFVWPEPHYPQSAGSTAGSAFQAAVMAGSPPMSPAVPDGVTSEPRLLALPGGPGQSLDMGSLDPTLECTRGLVASGVSGVRFVASAQELVATGRRLTRVRKLSGIVLDSKVVISKAARRRQTGLEAVVAVAPAAISGTDLRRRRVADLGGEETCYPSGSYARNWFGTGERDRLPRWLWGNFY